MPVASMPGSASTRNGIVMHTTCVKARYRCSATHPHITPYALPSGGDAAYLPARPHGTEEAPTCPVLDTDLAARRVTLNGKFEARPGLTIADDMATSGTHRAKTHRCGSQYR